MNLIGNLRSSWTGTVEVSGPNGECNSNSELDLSNSKHANTNSKRGVPFVTFESCTDSISNHLLNKNRNVFWFKEVVPISGRNRYVFLNVEVINLGHTISCNRGPKDLWA